MRFNCDNCEARGEVEDLEIAKHLNERLDHPIGHPLCVMPAGECPDCGALVYPRTAKLQFFNNNQETIWYITSEFVDSLRKKYDDLNGSTTDLCEDGSSDELHEEIRDTKRQIEDAELVAPLIEAAPSMHAALRRIIAEYKNGRLSSNAIKEAEEALAKAEIGN